MRLIHANPNECQECGMMCGDYHPYAACLMYKACGDVETVTQNLEQVQRHRTKDLEQQLVRQEDYYTGDRKRIADLEAENDRLENLLAEGVHSCSKTCKRPMCVLRREKAELEQQLEDLREVFKGMRHIDCRGTGGYHSIEHDEWLAALNNDKDRVGE